MNEQTPNLENYLTFHIGLDDTDSATLGGCTTYLGTKFFLRLQKTFPMIILNELPFLIRLNPNAPFRTKGNGSVIIKGLIHPSFISWLESIAIKFLVQYSKSGDEHTNPSLIIWYGMISESLHAFGKKALWDLIEIPEISEFLSLNNVFYHYLKGKRGLIGCLAGIGLVGQLDDFTFELLQYRLPPYDPERFENPDAVWDINEDDYHLFNCVDKKNKLIKIFPKGVDPVFCGIRGDRPHKLLDYWQKIQPQPEMECWMIFKTNQGTDAHILTTPIQTLTHPKFLPYRTVYLTGLVNSDVKTEIGGHVSFIFRDATSLKLVKCYAYEPTKEFRSIVLELLVGDKIEIAGNIRPADSTRALDQVINLEMIKTIQLTKKTKQQNPICPSCSKRMESAGKNQPFRCKNCKTTTDKSNVQIITLKRNILENKVYLPAIDAQRHLTKPLKRNQKNSFKDNQQILIILKKIFEQSL